MDDSCYVANMIKLEDKKKKKERKKHLKWIKQIFNWRYD